ncbi:MAG: hypothetical protein LBB98_01465 [Treponema sp.]|jgi:hypothetical protein|nr:hypothetical protein [Treponema sp.]
MGKRGLKFPQIAGIVLLAAGVVVLVIGIWQFVEFRQSVGGRLASGVNKLLGTNKIADGYARPIILMISGVAGATAGFFIYKKS